MEIFKYHVQKWNTTINNLLAYLVYLQRWNILVPIVVSIRKVEIFGSPLLVENILGLPF